MNMAEIIDLEFYRKFRIILPLRERAPKKTKSYGVPYTPSKRYLRRRKADPESTLTEKE
jgi:hypothetical protein